MTVRRFFPSTIAFGQAPFEPETIATIALMVVAPSFTEERDYDDWVKDVKMACGLPFGVDNLGTVFDWIYCRAAHTEQASFLNWARNSFNSTKTGTPTFTAFRGWSGWSSTNYLSIPYTAQLDNINLTSSDIEHGVFSNTNNNNAVILAGTVLSGSSCFIVSGNGSTSGIGGRLFSLNSASNNNLTSGNLNTIGLNTIRRISTTQNEVYKNGILQATSTQNFSSFNTTTSFMEGRANGFTGSISTEQHSFYYLAKGSVINQSLLYTAFKNYLVKKGLTGLP